MMLKCMTARVRGYLHGRTGMPCQDACKVYREPQRVAIAVADGHGNKRHLYSEDGSRIAVECAVDMLKELIQKENCREAVERNQNVLPYLLEKEWRRRVKEYHFNHPERRSIPDDITDKEVAVLYGTTLMAVLYHEDFLFAMQIGDGDITFQDKAGNLGRVIESELQIGSATYSLCMENSGQYVRTRLVDFQKDFLPVMVMLSTDGYANSFRCDEDFMNLVADYAGIVKKNSEEDVNSRLPIWLKQTSVQGSGDDITVGILCRTETERM